MATKLALFAAKELTQEERECFGLVDGTPMEQVRASIELPTAKGVVSALPRYEESDTHGVVYTGCSECCLRCS